MRVGGITRFTLEGKAEELTISETIPSNRGEKFSDFFRRDIARVWDTILPEPLFAKISKIVVISLLIFFVILW